MATNDLTPEQRVIEAAWIETYTGKRFNPLQPDSDLVCLDDIAHALSMLCRFGGHCKFFWSVAQHSLLVASIVPKKYRLRALLHDAAEAYLVDLPRPIKRACPNYRAWEDGVMRAIHEHFGIEYDEEGDRIVKEHDTITLGHEAFHLLRGPFNDWSLPVGDMQMGALHPEPPQAMKMVYYAAVRALEESEREDET